MSSMQVPLSHSDGFRPVQPAQRPTASDVQAALTAYQKARKRTENASNTYYAAPDDGPGGDGHRHKALERAVSAQIQADRRVAKLITALVGKKPTEDRPIALVLDGVPVFAYLNDDDQIRTGVPESPVIVAMATA